MTFTSGDTIETLWPGAKRGTGGNGAAVPDDADHFILASCYIDGLHARYGTPPVYTLGLLWRYFNGLWIPSPVESAALEIGRQFGGLKYCRRSSDFNGIAKLAAQLVADDNYFQNAPPGVAGPSMFWRTTDKGEIVSEPLSPAHRQRMRLVADPDFDSEAPLFERLLDNAFGTDEQGKAQHHLLKVCFGGALARALWRHRLAVLLLGKTTSGKSTLLSILKALFPPDQVSATSPQRWGSEYYLASLAGSAINIVGELDPHNAIPGGPFKQVVGCDVIEGRHPTHRPFSFVAQAAHFFNANKLPPTLDRSDAFFRRWRILHFKRSVPENEILVDLDQRIVAEEIGSVIAWMLEGAAYLARFRSVPETKDHRAMLEKWRNANNSALQFFTDPDACELDPEATSIGLELYRNYTQWAGENGVKAFGRNGFYEAIDEGAGRLGIHRVDRNLGVLIHGVRSCR